MADRKTYICFDCGNQIDAPYFLEDEDGLRDLHCFGCRSREIISRMVRENQPFRHVPNLYTIKLFADDIPNAEEMCRRFDAYFDDALEDLGLRPRIGQFRAGQFARLARR